MKKLLSIFTALVMVLTFPVVFASADYPVDVQGNFTEMNGEYPSPVETTVLKQKEWNGKSSLKENTCYFIDEDVTVSKNRTLPKSSMIVIENGGKLTVPEGKRLNISGALVLHSYAVLDLSGLLNIKSTSVFVLNGDANVLNSGKLNVYGFMQVSKGGALNVNGKVSVLNNGAVDAFGIVNLAEKTTAFKYTKKQGDDKQTYIVNELSRYADSDLEIRGCFDATKKITKNKLTYLRTFEAVLYRYNGGFYIDTSDIDILFYFNAHAYLNISNSSHYPSELSVDIYNWNGCFANIEDNYDYASGSFYSIVLGKPDIGLFAEVDQVYS